MSKTPWLMDSPQSATNIKADTPLHEYLVRLTRGENLRFKESVAFFRAITAKDANPVQIAGALVALSSKGETFEELAGMARVMREQAFQISTHHNNFIDISGTGSSSSKTFNVSTAAALVTAGAGLPVAKHSSRAGMSKTGSADALSQLDVNVSGDQTLAQACLNGAGICFMFAPKFHPTLLRVGEVKANLGIRSSLNLLGVLANPLNPPRQLLGVWHRSLVEPMAQALATLGVKKAWVVHGSDGLDEITLNGRTFVAEVVGNKIKTFQISPEDFGLKSSEIDHLEADSPASSAKTISEILESKRRDQARSLVVINAAAALLIAGKSVDPMQAARLAEQSIDSGSARTKLDRLIQTTNKKQL
ncbi:MAG: anthranilate phosphoribosyltransferase [Pyrinomonadaceae bacterium]|nr:anthranilate phosphoribosyltransferase [Pyrinomonadaceae bacterium]